MWRQSHLNEVALGEKENCRYCTNEGFLVTSEPLEVNSLLQVSDLGRRNGQRMKVTLKVMKTNWILGKTSGIWPTFDYDFWLCWLCDYRACWSSHSCLLIIYHLLMSYHSWCLKVGLSKKWLCFLINLSWLLWRSPLRRWEGQMCSFLDHLFSTDGQEHEAGVWWADCSPGRNSWELRNGGWGHGWGSKLLS